MCRNIKTLYNFDPPVTPDEVRGASLQFVRKITGFHKQPPGSFQQFLSGCCNQNASPGQEMRRAPLSRRPLPTWPGKPSIQLAFGIQIGSLRRFTDRLRVLDAVGAKPIVSRDCRLELGITRGSLE